MLQKQNHRVERSLLMTWSHALSFVPEDSSSFPSLLLTSWGFSAAVSPGSFFSSVSNSLAAWGLGIQVKIRFRSELPELKQGTHLHSSFHSNPSGGNIKYIQQRSTLSSMGPVITEYALISPWEHVWEACPSDKDVWNPSDKEHVLWGTFVVKTGIGIQMIEKKFELRCDSSKSRINCVLPIDGLLSVLRHNAEWDWIRLVEDQTKAVFGAREECGETQPGSAHCAW